MDALTGRLALLTILCCLGASPLLGQDPPAPVVDLGETTARSGEACTIPVFFSFSRELLAGWVIALRFDPSAMTVQAAGPAASHPAGIAMFFEPWQFAEPGYAAVNVLYDSRRGAPFPHPGLDILLANVEFCVLSNAPAAAYPVELVTEPVALEEQGKLISGYGLSRPETGEFWEGRPIIGSPGRITVTGEPSASPCSPPQPPPEPKVEYTLEADGPVSPGQVFDVRFKISSNVALQGLEAAIDFDEAVLTARGVEITSRWDGELPWHFYNISSDDGTVGMSLMPEFQHSRPHTRIPAGTNTVAILEFLVKPETDAQQSQIVFRDGIEQPYVREDGEPMTLIWVNGVTIDEGEALDPATVSFDLPVARAVGLMLAIQAQTFLRGDSNRNGKVEISDAVAILNYLFGGALPSACLDAADADDSGRLDITDSIRILGFLFLGGAPPAKPGPFDPGTDPTEDKLSCLE